MQNLTFPLRSVFLALPLEGQPKWQFQAFVEELKPYADIVRFQNPQSPHLTLMFWPSVGQLEYQGIVQQAQKIASLHAPFTMKVTGADTFGNRGEDHVLLLSIGFSEELARVKKTCPWSDGRPFAPHITLARIAHPQDVKSPVGDHVPFTGRFTIVKKKVMKTLEGIAFDIPVDRLRLYAEVNGAKQTKLEDFVFAVS
ncbi:MAG: 2'-5' RNA ligase family protein [Candidatus Peribacteraceae bacterium]|nr:2'-5' RNA ligase family protein [Candidatus Peribacteraceae bacterium]MDD5739921.1 2'-5' RNA ligase family protein [Candidatus Peribacteraceae bacterium]